MHDEFEEEIRELAASGNKIEAVKRYREEMGVDLASAKDAVEAIIDGQSTDETSTATNDSITDEVVSLLERGEKIQAVKLYREKSGVGLKEAKEAVEELARQNGLADSSGSGCLGMILIAACTIAAAT